MYLSLRGVFMSLSRLWVSSHHSVCTDAHQGVLFSTGPLHWLLLLHRAQTAVVCVWARWGGGSVAIAIIMPGHWRGGALYTKCVGWQLFLLSLLFFLIPMRWRLPATGEQCCFCDGLSRLRKSEPSFPLSGSMCTCAGIHVFVCVCLCACGFV